MKTRLPLLLLMFIAISIGCVLVGEPGWRGFRYWIYNLRHADVSSYRNDDRDRTDIDPTRAIGFCRSHTRIKSLHEVFVAACSGYPIRSLSLFNHYYTGTVELDYRRSQTGTRTVSNLVRDIPFQDEATNFLIIYDTDGGQFPVNDIQYILEVNRGNVVCIRMDNASSKIAPVIRSGKLQLVRSNTFNTVDVNQQGEACLKRWHQDRQAANWQLTAEQEANYEAEFFRIFER